MLDVCSLTRRIDAPRRCESYVLIGTSTVWMSQWARFCLLLRLKMQIIFCAAMKSLQRAAAETWFSSGLHPLPKKLFTSVVLRRLVSFSGLVANWCLCLQVVSSGSKVEADVMQSKETPIYRSKTGKRTRRPAVLNPSAESRQLQRFLGARVYVETSFSSFALYLGLCVSMHYAACLLWAMSF